MTLLSDTEPPTGAPSTLVATVVAIETDTSELQRFSGLNAEALSSTMLSCTASSESTRSSCSFQQQHK